MIRIYALIRRHGEQVNGAYQRLWTDSYHDFVTGKLSRTSLIGRMGALEHQREPWRRLADRIAELVTPAVRKAFVKAPPRNEAAVQLIIDVAQTAARMNLDREYPTVSFGQVGTRPDFSGQTQADPDSEPDLFVEVKLIRSKADVAKVLDEMMADIPKYADRGRSVLFLVSDKGGYIADDDAFAARLETLGPVRVRILR